MSDSIGAARFIRVEHTGGATVTITSNSTLPPTWRPCGGCGGAGGRLTPVDWAYQPQWIARIFCGGGGGAWHP